MPRIAEVGRGKWSLGVPTTWHSGLPGRTRLSSGPRVAQQPRKPSLLHSALPATLGPTTECRNSTPSSDDNPPIPRTEQPWGSHPSISFDHGLTYSIVGCLAILNSFTADDSLARASCRIHISEKCSRESKTLARKLARAAKRRPGRDSDFEVSRREPRPRDADLSVFGVLHWGLRVFVCSFLSLKSEAGKLLCY